MKISSLLPAGRCAAEIPLDCEFFFVGEAPGQSEEGKTPFLGASGQELRRIISDAEIPLAKCGFSNVFMDRPEDNKILSFTTGKADAYAKAKAVGFAYTFPPLQANAYVEPHRLWEVLRLRQEIAWARPKVIVPLGNTPLWALAGVTGIGKFRGAVMESTLLPGMKLVPTYHPAFILRVWDLRSIMIADLIKARKEALVEGIQYPKREIWLHPSLEDLELFERLYLPADILSVDIELLGPFISCIGFAPARDVSLVVPFVNLDGSNYWPDIRSETVAWEWVQRILWNAPSILMHNGLFDTQHLLASSIVPRHYDRDTMFKHHSMYPELQKALGFLGTIYCNERAWKTIRPRHKQELEKEEDSD